MILDLGVLDEHSSFRALHAAGATFVEIGRECGCDWRTARKYLAEDASAVPPTSPPRDGTQPLLITPLVPVIEAWLRVDVSLEGTVIHERLVAITGSPGDALAELDRLVAAKDGAIGVNGRKLGRTNPSI